MTTENLHWERTQPFLCFIQLAFHISNMLFACSHCVNGKLLLDLSDIFSSPRFLPLRTCMALLMLGSSVQLPYHFPPVREGLASFCCQFCSMPCIVSKIVESVIEILKLILSLCACWQALEDELYLQNRQSALVNIIDDHIKLYRCKYRET